MMMVKILIKSLCYRNTNSVNAIWFWKLTSINSFYIIYKLQIMTYYVILHM